MELRTVLLFLLRVKRWTLEVICCVLNAILALTETTLTLISITITANYHRGRRNAVSVLWETAQARTVTRSIALLQNTYGSFTTPAPITWYVHSYGNKPQAYDIPHTSGRLHKASEDLPWKALASSRSGFMEACLFTQLTCWHLGTKARNALSDLK
jgi:hypothetical protein